jgi:hypothetical protein
MNEPLFRREKIRTSACLAENEMEGFPLSQWKRKAIGIRPVNLRSF